MVFLGVIAGSDFALSWGWSICFHELLDMSTVLIYFVYIHDVLYNAFKTHHFWSALTSWTDRLVILTRPVFQHNLGLSGIFVSTSWHLACHGLIA